METQMDCGARERREGKYPIVIKPFMTDRLTARVVIHIPHKSRHHDQSDVHDEECRELNMVRK
jgi:hypothetical protein